MPTLDWIGKDAVIRHHKDVPFHLLEPDKILSHGDKGEGNLIIQGDNLHALKALLPKYAGKVKCIYIDPPYNTGMDDRDDSGTRTGWCYNDKVDSPEIRKWLGEVVGKEAEDLSRHDKWLCMIYPRLVLLKQLLKEDGVIFISIDDNEVSSLRLLMDEIYGRKNFLGCLIWKNTTDNNPTRVVTEHEYILAYAANSERQSKEWKSTNLDVKEHLLTIGKKFVQKYSDQDQRQTAYSKWFRSNKNQLWPFQDYKFIDSEGVYTGLRGVHNPGKEGYRYPIIHPETKRPCKEPLMGYRFPRSTMDRLLEEGRIIFGKDHTKLVEIKVYVKDYRAKLSSLFELDGRIGTNEIKAVFPEDKRPFDFPKPTGLIEELLSFTTTGEDLILDSFAGSGTTGQAVLQLNKADSQDRRFILIEMKQSTAETITAERVRRVAGGYQNSKGEPVEGLGSGFQYCRLSEEPLFNEFGDIRDDVSFAQLADFVWFSEAGIGYGGGADSPLLGMHEETAVYLLFNGILGDRRPQGGNILTAKILEELPQHNGPKIIYAAATRLGQAALQRENIIFKQTPYAIDI